MKVTNSDKLDMSDEFYTMEDLKIICEAVMADELPCSSMGRPDAQAKIILEFIKDQFPELRTIVLKLNKQDSNGIVFIFKYDHLRDVILGIDDIPDQVRYWYMSKLFGIPESNISEFLQVSNKALN